MEFLVERTIVGLLAIICPLLTMFDLPGNSILLLTGFGMAFFDENMYFNGRLLSAMVLVRRVFNWLGWLWGNLGRHHRFSYFGFHSWRCFGRRCYSLFI